MPTVLNEPEALAARQKIAAKAAEMLVGTLSFIEGTRELLALRSPAKLDQFDPDILPFVGAYSETDALPLGKVRDLWAPDALKKLEPEFEQKERWARSFCEEHCRRLVERFGVTPSFTALEKAALNEISERDTDRREALKKQIATATVIKRENSGAGFFTYLAVDPSHAPIKDAKRDIGNVAVEIEGFEGPLLLMLFMKDGYAHMLEAASVVDNTIGVDFANCRFEIRSH